jgi:hypothetical protein
MKSMSRSTFRARLSVAGMVCREARRRRAELLGQFAIPMNDAEAANLAFQRGATCNPCRSITIVIALGRACCLATPPWTRLKLSKAVTTLRATFEEIERARKKRHR